MRFARLLGCRLIVLFLSILPLFEAGAQERGRPFIRNFTPEDFKAETQNWEVLQGPDGLIYVANNSGVLEYDGVNWELIRLPEKTTTRALCVGQDGRIYVAGKNALGYLEPGLRGKTRFVSLNHLIEKPEDREPGDVWEVVAREDEIFFQANFRIYRYKDGKIKTWEVDNSYHRIFSVNNEIYVRQVEIGLCRLDENDRFVPIPGGEKFAQTTISGMEPFGKNGEILIGTRDRALMIFDPSADSENFRPFPTDADSLLSAAGIYHARQLNDSTYAFAVLRYGILVLNNRGRVLQKIGHANGLVSYGAYYVNSDQEGHLWAGLPDGVAKIDINSPLSYWGRDELDGSILDIERYKGALYMATLQGTYRLNKQNRPELIGRLKQPSWDLLKFRPTEGGEEQLLVSADNAVFRLADKRLETILPLRDNDTGFCLGEHSSFPNRVFVGRQQIISTIRYEKGQWLDEDTLVNLDRNVRNITEGPDGDLWISSGNQGLVRIIFNDNKNFRDFETRYYDTRDCGLRDFKDVRAEVINGKLLIISPGGLYEFNRQTEKFYPSKFLGDLSGRDIYRLAKGTDSKLWISGLNSAVSPVVAAVPQADGSYKTDDSPFKGIPLNLEAIIYPEADGTVWLGGSSGLFRYDGAGSNTVYQQKEPESFFRKIVVGKDSVLMEGSFFREKRGENGLMRIKSNLQSEVPVQLDFEYNSIVFHFASPTYNEGNRLTYSYKLEPYDKDWTSSTDTKKEYTNLPHGKYTFKVRASIGEEQVGRPAIYTFMIRPPWYKTPVAYLLYVFFTIFGVWGSVRTYTRTLHKDKENLEFIIRARTAEISQKNKALEKQKQEITSQHDDIVRQKTEIEKAYRDIETIGEIGQKITATLDFDNLIDTVYQNVNVLVDAPVFGVGIVNEAHQRIEFRGFIEKGFRHPFVYESLDDKRRFSVWCINNRKPVIINDLEKEYSNYLDLETYVVPDDVPKSLIYLPLLIEGKPVGAITVQSFEKNAYEELDITILQTLASYVAIALQNAKTYELIKESNKQITDSIRYAKTIQQAILPRKEEILSTVSDFFVLYRPKSIVSGDFYWFAHGRNGRSFIAAVDCTGHGVPGAFMSMIGNDLLSEIVNAEGLSDTAAILESLDAKIGLALRQADRSNDDGMDICLCSLQKQENGSFQIVFTGAKRPLFYFRNENLEFGHLKGDNRSVGGRQSKKRKFTGTTLDLKKGDMIYLTTDGLVDQGNAKQETFGTLQLKRLLKASAELPLSDQREVLKTSLIHHMQQMPQRDDITLLGLRL